MTKKVFLTCVAKLVRPRNVRSSFKGQPCFLLLTWLFTDDGRNCDWRGFWCHDYVIFKNIWICCQKFTQSSEVDSQPRRYRVSSFFNVSNRNWVCYVVFADSRNKFGLPDSNLNYLSACNKPFFQDHQRFWNWELLLGCRFRKRSAQFDTQFWNKKFSNYLQLCCH